VRFNSVHVAATEHGTREVSVFRDPPPAGSNPVAPTPQHISHEHIENMAVILKLVTIGEKTLRLRNDLELSAAHFRPVPVDCGHSGRGQSRAPWDGSAP
jgi:hypothetical protein